MLNHNIIETSSVKPNDELGTILDGLGTARLTNVRRYRTKRERLVLRVIGSHGQLTSNMVAALTGLSDDDAERICGALFEIGELDADTTAGTPSADLDFYVLTPLGTEAVRWEV